MLLMLRVISRWNYLVRCIPDIGDLLHPLEDVIHTKLLPNLTGQSAFNDVERDILSLPSRFGGLGVINPSLYASSQFTSSFTITAPLVDPILNQSFLYSMQVVELQLSAKQQAIASRRQFLTNLYNQILPILSPKLQRSVLLSREKGSSSWLTIPFLF